MFGGIFRVHRFVHRGSWLPGLFERGDGRLVLESKTDIVEAFGQNMLPKRVNFESKVQPMRVPDRLAGQVGGQRVAFFFFGTLEKLVYLFLGKRDRQDPVLEAIVVKNVGVAWSNQDAETVVRDGPGCVLAA